MNDIVSKPKRTPEPEPELEPAPEPIPTPEPAPTPAADVVAVHAAKPWYRQHAIWIIVTIVTATLSGGAYTYIASRPEPEPVVMRTPIPTPTPTPTPTPFYAPLTGLQTTEAASKRPIVAVVVENHPDARPQSGLSQAGVVYEALAEGGITRFLAFFGDQQAPTIGPVRSLRTYFIDWGLEFGAPVAHAGGNADALGLIVPLGMKNLEALGIGAPTFYRTRDRYAPHNLYTSSTLLDSIMARYGFATEPNFTVSPRQQDQPGTAPHPNIHIEYSYTGYQVDYIYDPATNDYARKLAGQPHIDRNTGAQIRVKNIVVEYMPTSYGYTRIGEQKVIMPTVGSGKAVVFRDGTAITGTWHKSSNSSRTELIDAAGKPIPLNAGNTWYSIVPTTKAVSY